MVFICISSEAGFAKQGEIDSLLSVLETAKEDTNKVNALNNLSLELLNTGDFLQAKKYADDALSLSGKINFKKGKADAYNNIGIIYLKQGNYEEAVNSHFASFQKEESLKDIIKNTSARINLGFASIKLKIFSDAKKFLDNELLVTEKYVEDEMSLTNVNKNKEKIEEGSDGLPSMDSIVRNYKRALEYYKLFTVYKDSFLIEENNMQAAQMKTQYEAEKKDDEIMLLNNEKNIRDLKFKEQQSQLFQQKLLAEGKENDIQILNQSMEIKMLELGKKEGELKEQKLVTDGKEKVVLLLNKNKEVQEQEMKRQAMVRNGFIGGFAIVLLFAGVFFTQRNKISRGKKRSDELLLNILPSETAEELKAKGTAKAKDYGMVTVMFTDFKNFTQVSESMTAEELVKEIDYCYCRFDKIITSLGIEKIKTLGDGYMCAGGLPVENKTNPEDTVHAALEIQHFMEQLRNERIMQNKPFFEARIGLHTGPVVAGIVGIKKFAYDIWGNTVNIASRIETCGEVGRVNISGTTYELVKDKFSCIHRGKIEAKNKGMIDMYFVEDIL